MSLASLGLRSDRSHQSSQSQSSSYGYAGSQDRSSSISGSRSVGGSQATQNIAFEELFRQMFSGATGAASRAAELSPELEGQAARLFSGGVNFLDELGGGAGEQYLESRLGGNPQLDQQIDALGGDIGRFLSEEVNPAIRSRGVAAGAYGGGRQQVAQGKAAGAALEEFQRGAIDLRARDLASRDAAASELMTGRTAAAGTGLAALPDLFGLAQGGAQAGMAPYLALAQILGGPTVLQQSSSFDESTSSAIAEAMARSFGEDFSSSSSSMSGKSKGWGFQIGMGP